MAQSRYCTYCKARFILLNKKFKSMSFEVKIVKVIRRVQHIYIINFPTLQEE